MKAPKEIAIVSLFDYLNYGNSLQRLAVQRLLADRGYESVSFNVRPHPLLGRIKDLKNLPACDRARQKSFMAFSERMGVKATNCKPQSLVKTVQEDFLGAVIGSDQIWNPLLFGLGSRTDGLGCLNGLSGESKIALCPSFGIATMPDEWASRYAEWLGGFERISVRENEGAEIVRELTGKEAEVLVDPTMAFGAERWREVADYSVCPSGDYVLTYFLGEEALSESVRRYAAEREMSVVPIMDKGSEWYKLPPDGFVALIDRAKLVITDSFHAAAFSLMLHTDFAIAQRKQTGMCDMLSRLNTLCAKFGCEDAIVFDDLDGLGVGMMDWAEVDSRLEVEVVRFENYLDSELERLESHA